MIKILSERKALEQLAKLRSEFRDLVALRYEHKAKSCLTCEVKGSCCLDAHFVNVRISRLEATAIRQVLSSIPACDRSRVEQRIENAVVRYSLSDDQGRTFACPLFEPGIGCLVHQDGKPLPCIAHACYESSADLPPDELLNVKELEVDRLNMRTYGSPQPLLPLPLAISRLRA